MGASVRLHRPVPLEERLLINELGDGISIHDRNGHIVATAHQVEPFVLVPPTVPDLDAALEASGAHPLRGGQHALFDCVVGGPERSDGLGVTPWPLASNSSVLAAPTVGTTCSRRTLAANADREVIVGEPLTAAGWTFERRRRSVETAGVLGDDRCATVASAGAVWAERESS